VTFRLAGTLPKPLLEQMEQEREQLADKATVSRQAMSSVDIARLRELHTERIEAYLDAGHGECWLRRRDIAQLVAGAITHFADSRYTLHAWTVMPNHVHVVFTPLGPHSLTSILHSWKGFTGSIANQMLGRKGKPFWQRESYDRLVRNEREFHVLCEYTVANPVTARLCEHPEDWPYGSAAARDSEA